MEFKWTKFSEDKPVHGSVIMVKLKNGDEHETCSFWHGIDYFKEYLSKEATMEDLQKSIDKGETPMYICDSWEGNTPTTLDIESFYEWKYVHDQLVDGGIINFD